MDFRILGPVELRSRDGRVDLGPLKQRTVLAALLVDAGRPVTQEQLIERVWDDSPPAEVRNALYTYATRLRRILSSAPGAEDAQLLRRSGGYLLDVDAAAVDAFRFAALAAEVRAAGLSDERRSELARRALAESGAVPLADLTSRWAVRVREHLVRRRRDLLTLHAALEIRLDRAGPVVDGLYEALAEQPLAEDVVGTLMSALYFSGRSAEALALFAATRCAIVAELGVEPGSDLRRTHEEILRGRLARPAITALAEVGGATGTAARRPAGQPVATSPTASMLPADTPFHTGRDAEVAEAIKALTSSGRTGVALVAVVGASGLGKSALAIHVAHRVKATYPDGQLYVDLRDGAREQDAATVLARFLRALGAAAQELPQPAEELAELYRGRMAGRRVLVVLDGVEDEALISALLPATPGCGVLVTGRGMLAGIACSRIVLDVLDQPGAVRLLAAVAGEERVWAEPEAARTLAEMCGRLPLAVRIAGARLVARPHWSLSRLVAQLTDERRRLDELAHGQLDVRVALGHSYRGLDQQARVLFRQLGRLDVDGFGQWLVPRLLGVDAAHADEALDQLVDAQVVYPAGEDPNGRPFYRFGHLARLYALDLADAEGTDREARQIATLRREIHSRLAADRVVTAT